MNGLELDLGCGGGGLLASEIVCEGVVEGPSLHRVAEILAQVVATNALSGETDMTLAIRAEPHAPLRQFIIVVKVHRDSMARSYGGSHTATERWTMGGKSIKTRDDAAFMQPPRVGVAGLLRLTRRAFAGPPALAPGDSLRVPAACCVGRDGSPAHLVSGA